MKILVAGDFCPRYRVEKLFNYCDFTSVLGEIKNVTNSVDYSIVNFECPVCNEGTKPIVKYGPNLFCSESGVEALKYVGFNCVTLANNHFFDYGEDGVRSSLMAFNRNHVDFVGGGTDLCEAARILYKQIGEKKLAIINCCENEFSIATEQRAGSNPLNPIRQYYAIKEAKSNADYTVIIVHGGHEQYNLPSPRMKEIYHFFVDVGADAVINHHQHCYSGYEVYKEKPIFYGLGNFCFDYEGIPPVGWNEGYMIILDFSNGDASFEIIPYEQCKNGPFLRLLSFNAISDELERLNKIICDDVLLKKYAYQYYKECMKTVAYTIEPTQNRYIAALQHRRILPSPWVQSWMVKLRNFVMCESHRDKLEYFLKNFNKYESYNKRN